MTWHSGARNVEGLVKSYFRVMLIVQSKGQ
jgi:hypothetical protein